MGSIARCRAADGRAGSSVDLERESANGPGDALFAEHVPKLLNGRFDDGTKVLRTVLGLEVAVKLGLVIAGIKVDDVISRVQGLVCVVEGLAVLLEEPVGTLNPQEGLARGPAVDIAMRAADGRLSAVL